VGEEEAQILYIAKNIPSLPISQWTQGERKRLNFLSKELLKQT